MDQIAADDTPLSHVDEDALQQELELRKAARAASPSKPADNPRARIAGSSADALAKRSKLAEERSARVHAARDKRERAAAKARDEAFREAQEQARRAERAARASSSYSSSRSAGSSSSGRSRTGGKRRSARSSAGSGDKIAKYYKVLDLPVGAPYEDVKKSYRKLMRKYHPDRHVGNAKKQKAATELSMRVTQAYKELEDHLKGKK